MSGKRYPGGAAGVGRELTEFGNELAGKQYDDINSEWQTIQLGANFIGPSLEDSEYLLNQVQKIENNVIFVFDFAITAISLYRDFLFFLPNFMNAVVTYIAGILYNALDAFLRLGMYALVVPPNLSDTSYKGLPTTNLKEQASNAYKKFYDYSDPNIPYYLPFEKGLAEQIIDSGEKQKNKLKYYFEDSALAGNLNPSGEKRPYMERDFLDFEKSVENLSRPGGIYDAIYLYFSISYTGASSRAIENFINAMAMISDVFKFPTIEGLLKEYDSLFRPKRKRIQVLCTDKIAGVSQSSMSKAKENVRKIDLETNKQVYVDPDLENFRIFESDPSSSMTPEKKAKISDLFQEQLDYDVDLLSNLQEQGFSVLVEFNKKNNVEYQQLEKDIAILEDEIGYYDFKTYVIDFLNTTSNVLDFDAFYNNLKNNEQSFVPGTPANYANVISFKGLRTDFYAQYDFYYGVKDKSTELSTAALNNMTSIMSKILDVAENIRNEIVVSITPPNLAQADRIAKLQEKIDQLAEVESTIEENTKEYLENDVANRVEKTISEKRKQIDYINGLTGNTSEVITDLSKAAQITFCKNFYANSGRASLYESYLEKFYNFNTKADSDFMYEFVIEVDATAGEFSTKVDSFHAGQFVQIRENVGGGSYAYRGSGVIVSEVEEVFEDAGYGTWVKANFSDIIGLTADIKRLQNEIMGFQNLFEPNTTFFDLIIQWLKDVKARILEVVDLLKNLIELIKLLLSVNFEGKVQGKYIRNEEYDRMAIGLTDTSNLTSGTSKSNFKPSNLSSVQRYLSQIRELDKQEAENFRNEIDTLFTKTAVSDDDDRKQTLSDKSIIDAAYPNKAAMLSTAEALRDGIKNELKSRTNSILNLFDLGSSLYANLEDVGIVPVEEGKQIEKDNKITYYKAKTFVELAKAESQITKEFGFSLILLSYLPKGIPFYPVRFLAQQLGLIEQTVKVSATKVYVQDLGSPDPQVLNELEDSVLAGLMPNKTKADLIKSLSKVSQETSPTAVIAPAPVPLDVKLEPLTSTIDFSFVDSEVNALATDTTFLTVGGSNIQILKSLNRKYLAGAKLLPTNASAFQLGSGTNAVNSNHKYLYRFDLNAGAPGGCGPDDPELDKIQIHFGVFQANQPNIAIKAFELNSDGNQIFRFGRRTEKTFKGEIYLKQDKKYIIPYILIGYDDLDSLDIFTFELKNTQIYFYRVA